MDFRTCTTKRLVKPVRPDTHLYNSLVKSSEKKLKSQKLLILNDDTASSKISLTYDAIRELLEAMTISRGYKIYNHECYTAFLKEIMNESPMGDKFDIFRQIRNDINYYGKDIKSFQAKTLLDDMVKFVEALKSKFF